MKKIYFFLAIGLFYNFSFSQGETCASAIPLAETGIFGGVSDDTTSSGDNGGSNASNDLWYIVSPGSAQTINVWLCNSTIGYDFKLSVYSGTCGSLSLIAKNDDSCGLYPEVSFQSESGVSYYVVVEGADNPGGTPDEGPFEINTWYETAITPPNAPNGVNCNSATSGSNVFFSDELDVLGGWTGDIVTTHTLDSWEIGTGKGSHSPDTGPNSAHSGTSYLSFDTEGGSISGISTISPAIDLSSLNIVEDAELSFYMHAYGVDMGILNVGVSTTGSSGPFTNEFTWSGQFQSVDTQDWVNVGIDLTAYIGDVIYIEFKFENYSGSTSGDFHSDMAIDLVEVTVCDTVLSVEKESVFEDFSIYPNPATDILNLKADDNIDEISIYNLLGQEVKHFTPNKLQTIVDISNLQTGMYIVKVQIGKQIGSYRIVKQ